MTTRMRLTLLTALVVVLGLVATTAAMATGTTESTAAQSETKTITVALEDDGSIDWTDPDLWTMGLLEEAGNLTIEVMPIAQSDREAKMQTLVASGDIPDMVYNEDEFWYWSYAARLGVKMDEHWDQLPNFTKRIERYPNFESNFRTGDGVYGLPMIMDSIGYYSYMWMIRADILEQQGMALNQVQTMDDFRQALTTIRNAKGKPPWVARLDDGEPTFIDRFARAYGTGERVYWNVEAGQFQLGPFDGRYRDMVQTLRDFYADGLIHPEIFSMQDQVWEQMVLADEGYFFIDNWKARWTPLDTDRADFQVMLPPAVGGRRYYGAQDRPHASPDVKYWVISKATDALSNILTAVNWAYSDEAVAKFNFGIEGETYKVIDGTPMVVWDGGPTRENWYNDHIKPLGIRSGRNSFVTVTESYLGQMLPGNEFILERAKYYTDNGVVADAAPVIQFTSDELDRVQMLRSSIDTHILEQVAKFVTGGRNMNQYAAFLTELRGMGGEEVVEIYNTALARIR